MVYFSIIMVVYFSIIIYNMDWEKEVKPFIEKLEDDNRMEFKLMMQEFYQLI